MSLPERRDTVRFPSFPDLFEWLESPMFGLRPFSRPVRIEDFTDDGHYVVRAELPGIDPDKDLDITVDQGMLHIHAEKTRKREEARRSEFEYGSLSRSVALPPGADPDDVKATYRDGVLEVSVGLSEAEKPSGKRVRANYNRLKRG